MIKSKNIFTILIFSFSMLICSCSNNSQNSCQHEWGTYEIIDEATCIAEGKQSHTCIKCGKKETSIIPIKDHNWDEGKTIKPATHYEEGVKKVTCKDCSATLDIPVSIIPHNFSYVSINDNEHLTSCECGYNLQENHSYDQGEKIKNETHLTDGEIIYTCSLCEHKKHVIVPKLSDKHSWSAWNQKDSEYHQRNCECGQIETELHNFDNGTINIQPTHTTFGEIVYTCKTCNYQKTEKIEKIGAHSFSNWEKADEMTHKKVCECGETIIEQHQWGEGKIIDEKTGSIKYTCSVCNATKIKTVGSYETISNYVFNNITGNKIDNEPYPFYPMDLETPIYDTTFRWNEFYDFNNVELSKYDEVFFYYKQIENLYPAFYDSQKEICFYNMSIDIGDSSWHKFSFTYNEASNSWSISSSFVNLTGLEIDNLSNFKLQTGGSKPEMELSPLFGKISLPHYLNKHTLDNTGYEIVEDMPLDLSTQQYESHQLDYILANDMATFSNYVDFSNQTDNILFKEINEDKYNEIKFYFRSINKTNAGPFWIEIGLVSKTTYDVFASNAYLWNEILLQRNQKYTFDIYANGVKKGEVSSLKDLRVKINQKQLISPLFGKINKTNILLVSQKKTSYKIAYHVDDARYGKHSANLIADSLNKAVGNQIFTTTSMSINPNPTQNIICIGLKFAQLAGIECENIKGLNYKITVIGNVIYIFGDTNFGTNNGVKYFLNDVINYEYFYKGVEQYNNDVSTILFNKNDVVSNTSFLVGYDVNAETRSDAGYTWEKDFSYSLNTGLVGDGASGKYTIYGGWHNEASCAADQNIPMIQTSIRSNPQKHMDLTSNTNAYKVATWLNQKFYSAGKNEAMFCLTDDYSWYNKTDKQSTYSPTYYSFINKIADNLENIVDHDVYLVAVAYHQSIVCPDNYVPHSGKHVKIKIYLSDSDAIFTSKPSSIYNDRYINMQDDIADSPTLQYNPYRNLLKWGDFLKKYNIEAYAYLYCSLPNYFAPFDTVDFMVDWYNFLKDLGVTRTYDMGQYDNANATDWTRLKTYLKGKLTNNCNISKTEFDNLILDFFNAYYGPASTYMKAAFDKEYHTITNPSYPGEEDYTRHYGRSRAQSCPLYLRGYYYGKKILFKYTTSDLFENKSKTGIMDYYDKALQAVSGNKTLEDRVKLDGLSLRYWYWICTASDLYGCGPTFGFNNNRNEIFEQIVEDAKILGVTKWGEGAYYTIDHAVKG